MLGDSELESVTDIFTGVDQPEATEVKASVTFCESNGDEKLSAADVGVSSISVGVGNAA